MGQSFRRSSRGNPFHYPKNDPQGRGGQFAPKGYAAAAAAVCGMYFQSRDAFEAAERNGELNDHEYYHKQRSSERFNEEATEGQVAFAAKIQKALGVPMPDGGTKREISEYIDENIADYNSATEGQSRAIRHIEENTGHELAGDDRYGGNAGSYIGYNNKSEQLRDPRNWEEGPDGNLYCIARQYNEDGSLKLKKDGTPYGTDTGYRLVREKINGKTRYRIQRGDVSYEEGPDGKKHKVRHYRDIEKDGAGVKSLVKDAKSDAFKRCALNEQKRYEKGVRMKPTKREPNNIRRTVEEFESMGNNNSWQRDDSGRLSFGSSWNADNQYNYVIEQGTTGLHAYRDVKSVKTVSKYDEATGTTRKVSVITTRREWVTTGCQSEAEAIEACRRHEAQSIISKRVSTNAASDKEIKRWVSDGRIKSKNEYKHLLDPVKNYLK